MSTPGKLCFIVIQNLLSGFQSIYSFSLEGGYSIIQQLVQKKNFLKSYLYIHYFNITQQATFQSEQIQTLKFTNTNTIYNAMIMMIFCCGLNAPVFTE